MFIPLSEKDVPGVQRTCEWKEAPDQIWKLTFIILFIVPGYQLLSIFSNTEYKL